ncbi:hypothetical protein KAFR_0G03830 [Kazachstania africana CBS 2517]|uniref:Helicase ATP-binding domain-containing protein n=1 Tax=Kazachstania africana (strain ATCC 22294 / BCRC 22015 / CBS 2517 / CECT 1963 / NBRC 1671 / NRRL Y-8276) TaxID=1071382 RepID=H2AYG6_KAZAF|nr:hypothetical protein KAFR_0G03830 [Kazachstania africana CBS 2517]CCF59416.1 hypothetical protein KAFR_0G03830 [Kazachstania africana CBS 2517]
MYDLVKAGGELFENFEFKSSVQERFTSAVINSNERLLALQAITAFGRSLTFILPVLALKRKQPGKYVHFVAVPYESLKMATRTKLENAGLVVGETGMLTDLHAEANLSGVDVLVGCFDSYGDAGVADVMKLWEKVFGTRRSRGIFVFDEAHVLWLEKSFRNIFHSVKGLNWKSFLKVVFVSATLSSKLGLFFIV